MRISELYKNQDDITVNSVCPRRSDRDEETMDRANREGRDGSRFKELN